MAQTTIEWTATYNDDGTVTPGFTFNPWTGCLKVSPGCKFCYAEALSNRWGKDVWGPGPKRQRTSVANWKKPLQWNKQAANEGRRFKVFCASMADVFEDNPQLEPWRVDLLELIQETPRLDWLLLTKRPENVNRMIEQATGFSEAEMWFHSAPNVWLGTSVENQEYADKRIPELLKIPAKIRFLSCEPLLGPVNLSQAHAKIVNVLSPAQVAALALSHMRGEIKKLPMVDWVIVGGESGHRARPMHPAWARSLRDQCQGAGVAFFFKQWGEFLPVFNSYTTKDGYSFEKIGKHAAGRSLDGVEWSQFPQVTEATQC